MLAGIVIFTTGIVLATFALLYFLERMKFRETAEYVIRGKLDDSIDQYKKLMPIYEALAEKDPIFEPDVDRTRNEMVALEGFRDLIK